MENKKTYNIHILRRPWYEWVLWALWLLVEVFFAQSAFASVSEHEPRAQLIYWVIFAVLLIAGGIVWYARRARLMAKPSASES